jgi:hypothetical protein
MPDLNVFLLRSNPRVFANDRLIKDLYYSETSKGRNAVPAFHMACGHLLERKPFLMMDFRSSRFFPDADRDGCADTTRTLALPGIDPADFLPVVDGVEELCNEDLLGHREINDSPAVSFLWPRTPQMTAED